MNKSLWILYFVVITFFFSCSNKMEDINELFEKPDLNIEYATDVKVIYSDSAKVRLQVQGEELERHVSRSDPKDVFKNGVYVEFLDPNQNVVSWLKAQTLVREEKSGLVIVTDDVVFYNRNDDKLVTTQLIWDEQAEKVYTDRYVRIFRPAQGDTLEGFGYETNKDFTKHIIKNRFSGKMNIQDLSKALEQ